MARLKLAARQQLPRASPRVLRTLCAEFRRLMLYIQRHSELLTLFDMIDTGGDRRVSEAEFRAAVPLLVGWGIPVDDPAEEWARMDADNGGQILFGEFAHAALSAGLQSGERAAPSPAGEKL